MVLLGQLAVGLAYVILTGRSLQAEYLVWILAHLKIIPPSGAPGPSVRHVCPEHHEYGHMATLSSIMGSGKGMVNERT